MGADVGARVSEDFFSNFVDRCAYVLQHFRGRDVGEAAVVEFVNFPVVAVARVSAEACYRLRPVDYRVELAILIVVLCDLLVANLRLLVPERDCERVGVSKEGVVVGEYFVAGHEDEVLGANGPGLPVVRADVGIFATSHGVEQCAAEELGASLCSRVLGCPQAMSEDRWLESLLVFLRWVCSIVAAGLAADVLVYLASAVCYWAPEMMADEGRRHIIEGLSGSACQDLLRRSTTPKVTSSFCMHESTAEA